MGSSLEAQLASLGIHGFDKHAHRLLNLPGPANQETPHGRDGERQTLYLGPNGLVDAGSLARDRQKISTETQLL